MPQSHLVKSLRQERRVLTRQIGTGTLRVGSLQTVTSGTWTTSPTFTYQWQKSSDGIARSNIGLATTKTYTPTFDLANLNLRVVINAGNGIDTSTVTSNIINNLLPPVATAVPTITGTKSSSGQGWVLRLGLSYLDSWPAKFEFPPPSR